MTCITPRAFADDTAALLKPLSCQAIADASEPGTPCSAAIWPISAAFVRPAVGSGPACGIVVGAGWGADVCGAPAGSLSAVPLITCASGAKPFIAATACGDTPAFAAIPVSVSRGLPV